MRVQKHPWNIKKLNQDMAELKAEMIQTFEGLSKRSQALLIKYALYSKQEYNEIFDEKNRDEFIKIRTWVETMGLNAGMTGINIFEKVKGGSE